MNPARQMWRIVEPLHAVLYYAPEVYDEAMQLGYPVDVRWPSYFAWRAAPLGAAGPAAVSSAFYSFSPRMVAEHVPAAWRVSAPAAVLERRWPAIDRALRALLGDTVDGPEVAEAAALARRAAEAADTTGRPLAAANRDLGWSGAPHVDLWQAATLLREHRGDGHIAAALTAGFGPCELLVSFAAAGAAPAEVFASRGWTTEEWTAAQDSLTVRGWLHPDGTPTEAGAAARADLESRTDTLAAAPWRELGPATGRFAQLTGPLAARIAASGLLPKQSTLGMGAPARAPGQQ
ncbi:SCO6745 family protein [Actinoplanes philippinensis]|uniref:SCO6745 family protein n=1 Tax=Actinoplanes philippinensis TaxID=35752 RepID=UPI001EF19A1C|nr:hypothetical protein [Actinoplanes philippinensis]